MYFIGTFKSYGMQVHIDDEFITKVAFYATFANIFGRMFWGFLIDFCNPFLTLCLLSLVNSISIVSYFEYSAFSMNYYALLTILIFFCHGGNMTIFMPITITCFGSQHISNNYGCIYLLFSILNVGNTMYLSAIKVDFQGACWMLGMIAFLGWLSAIGLLIHVWYRQPWDMKFLIDCMYVEN